MQLTTAKRLDSTNGFQNLRATIRQQTERHPKSKTERGKSCAGSPEYKKRPLASQSTTPAKWEARKTGKAAPYDVSVVKLQKPYDANLARNIQSILLASSSCNSCKDCICNRSRILLRIWRFTRRCSRSVLNQEFRQHGLVFFRFISIESVRVFASSNAPGLSARFVLRR